jgi:hypothetical protein
MPDGADFFDYFTDKELAARCLIRVLLKRCGGTATVTADELEQARNYHLFHRGQPDRFHIALGKLCTDPNCKHTGA